MIDDKQLAEWSWKTSQATPGPWEVGDAKYPDSVGPFSIYYVPGEGEYVCERNDAEFVSAAREAMPLLIQEVRELRAKLALAKGLA